MALLEVKDLHTQFLTRDGIVRAVDGVSFYVNPGETLGIVGESGCGKSITALSILRLVPKAGEIVSGEILYQGQNLLKLNTDQMLEARWKKIAMIFQDPMTSRAIELLKAVGLGDRVNNKPSELSGGQQQRIAVARALASKPSFVLADEPTANLDSVTADSLLDLMENLNKEFKMTFVFSTHDQRVINRAHRIMTLHDGAVDRDELIVNLN